MAIRFFDMFAGIGGFRSGLEAVGGFECIGHCEIDKKANQAYNAIYQARLQQQLGNIRDGQLKREQTQSRLDDIYTILDGLKNRPMEYDEQIVRQLLECITVDSKEQITVIFVGGLKVVQPLID